MSFSSLPIEKNFVRALVINILIASVVLVLGLGLFYLMPDGVFKIIGMVGLLVSPILFIVAIYKGLLGGRKYSQSPDKKRLFTILLYIFSILVAAAMVWIVRVILIFIGARGLFGV